MKITVLKEKIADEKRVALTPEGVKKLVSYGFQLYVEKNAGIKSSYSDEQYIAAGAKISTIALELLADADILLKVQATNLDDHDELNEVRLLRSGAIVIGQLTPSVNQSLIKQYRQHNITSFSLELMPVISRAQPMNILASQDSLIGYRAVIEAAHACDILFPMMMTSAGIFVAAKVLIIGVNVTGLQAIATAKRLGAIVSVYDSTSEFKDQVESLGANFINQQFDNLKQALQDHDIIICTAQINDKINPVIITEELLNLIKSGAVIIDIINSNGQNCALSQNNKTVIYNGIKIIAYDNLASHLAKSASVAYSNNIVNFINLLVKDQQLNLDLNDEIIDSCLVTYRGEIINKTIQGA